MEWKASRTRKLVSLFVVTTLAVASAGCTRSSNNSNECWDNNNDGYCDDDGSHVGSSYYMSNGQKRYTKASSGISSGTESSKSSSGIGSSTSSSSS